MTNSGTINLYKVPEIEDRAAPAVRLQSTLTGLEAESFALSWNRQQKGKLVSCAE